MFEVLRSRWLASALAFAGLVSQARAESPAAYKPDQHVIVRLGTKGDRRCVVVAVKAQPDGLIEYQMKAIDNGEMLTIYDRPGQTRPAPVASAVPLKPAVSNDPLLASSLRKTTATPAEETKPAETVLAAAPPKREGPLQRLQEWMPKTQKNTERPAPGVQTPAIVKLDPFRDVAPPPANVVVPASNVGKSVVDGMTGADRKVVPALASGKATTGGDPAPLNMVRPPSQTASVADPVPLGFTIPVNNTPVTPTTRNYEREERIVALGAKLKDALQPSARENAAESLTEGVGADSAAVRSLLLTAAANDPSPNVRATCVRCLVKIGVRDTAFLALLAAGKLDPDVRVRLEIDRAEEMFK